MIKTACFVSLLTLLFSLGNTFANEIGERKPYAAYIRPNSILTDIKTKKNFTNPNGIYTTVLSIHPTKSEEFWVYNSKGEAVYTTLASSVLDIEEDVRVLPKTNAQLIYPPTPQDRMNNKFARFSSQLSFSMENMPTDPFNGLYIAANETATLSRFEFKTIYQSNWLIDFGIVTNFQYGSWLTDEDRVSLTILSIGPVIEKKFYENEKVQLRFSAGAEFAPIYQTSTEENRETYFSLILGGGVEASFDTYFGHFTLGTFYRRHDLTLSNSRGYEHFQVPEEIITNSFGVSAGYKIYWDL